MHPANDVARVGIQDVDKVSRAVFPGRDVQELPARMNRQPVDIWIDGPIPEHRIIVDIKAIDHPDAGAGAVGHVEPAVCDASGDALNIVYVANGLDGLNKAMLGADFVDRYRTPGGRRL